MFLRVGGNRDLDVGITRADARHQLGRGPVAVGMGGIGGADAAGRIATQRHDMADAELVIAADDVIDLAARRADAGEVRRRREAGFMEDAGDGRMRALPGRAAGAIGDRDEFGQ